MNTQRGKWKAFSRNIFVFVLFLFLFQNAHSQKIIRGKVVNMHKQPVENANVIVKGTSRGTSTDKNGNFSIKLFYFPSTLVVSDIRHHTDQIEITEEKKFCTVELLPKNVEIGEVIVSDKLITNIHPDSKLTALDFEFYDEFIVAIIFKHTLKSSFLMILDDAGNEVCRLDLDFKPEKLFKDCTGKIHLISETTAFQIYYDYEKIQLLYPIQKDYFLWQMEPCKSSIEDKLVFNYPKYKKLISDFYVAGDTLFEKFYSICDSSKIAYFETKYDLKHFINLRKFSSDPRYKTSVSFLNDNIKYFREICPLDWEDQQILKPVFSHAYNILNEFYLFDYTNGQVVSFDDNWHAQDSVKIDFHFSKDWTEQTYVDEVTGKIYTTFIKNGMTYISRIDGESFEALETVKVPDYKFVQKMKIRNNYAFFIYKDIFSNDFKMIYKMPI